MKDLNIEKMVEKLYNLRQQQIQTVEELMQIDKMIREKVRSLKELEERTVSEYLEKWRNKEIKTKEQAMMAAKEAMKNTQAGIENELNHLKEAELEKKIEKLRIDAEIERLRFLIQYYTALLEGGQL